MSLRRPMTASLWSLAIFNIYVWALALSLLIAPNLFLRLLGIPETREVWVRCAGMLLLGYAFYYVCVIHTRMVEFLRFTVWVRSAVILFFGTFVLLGWAPKIFLLFGVTDLAGAVWTAVALHVERSREVVPGAHWA